MKIEKVDSKSIPESAYVTVTRMNHLVEVQYMEKVNRSCNIKKLDSERYVLVDTGEICEFNKTVVRSQSINSLRQTFKKMRYLINNNFVGAMNELFVTLTYRGDLQTNDHLQVGKDYDNFMKRLKRRYGKVEAIKVLEPHASGNYHMHVLLRFDDFEKIYIPNKVDRVTGESIDAPLRDIWGNGNVTIQSLKNVDNIGAYVSAYLADIELNDENVLNFVGKDFEYKMVEGKSYVKGGRLQYYKAGVNIFSKTKGIAYPSRQEMSYTEAKKIVGAATPHYKKSIELVDDKIDYSNSITYEQYNLKR